MILAAYNVLVAAYMVVLQAIDLHTTSEGLKHKVAREDNDNLADLNAEGPHAGKFWLLAAYKIGAALLSVGMGVTAWYVPQYAELVAVLQTALAVYYTRVMVSNWRIYKSIGNSTP